MPVDVPAASPPNAQLLTPLAKDTGLVTFGVCQHNPRLITLANINTLRAMSHQPSHLGVLVIPVPLPRSSAELRNHPLSERDRLIRAAWA